MGTGYSRFVFSKVEAAKIIDHGGQILHKVDRREVCLQDHNGTIFTLLLIENQVQV